MCYSISVKEHTHKFILPPFLFLLESLIERLGSYIFNSIVHKVDTDIIDSVGYEYPVTPSGRAVG